MALTDICFNYYSELFIGNNNGGFEFAANGNYPT